MISSIFLDWAFGVRAVYAGGPKVAGGSFCSIAGDVRAPLWDGAICGVAKPG